MRKNQVVVCFVLVMIFGVLSSGSNAACNRAAFKSVKAAAEGGQIKAMLALSQYYKRGDCVRVSQRWEANWVQRAAVKGHNDALRWLLHEARNKNPAALHNLGLMHRKGWRLKKDYKQALKYYEFASGLGYSLSTHWIGIMHRDGLGMPVQKIAALLWFRKAAARGRADSEYQICMLYLNGGGVKRRPNDAARHCRVAADRGDINGMLQLALMHRKGIGVKRSASTALGWVNRAYKKGKTARATLVKAEYLRLGIGTRPDWSAALLLYRRVFREYSNAQFFAAEMYYHGGNNLKKDRRKSRSLYIESATQGNARAKAALKARFPKTIESQKKEITKSKKKEFTPEEFKKALDEYFSKPKSQRKFQYR